MNRTRTAFGTVLLISMAACSSTSGVDDGNGGGTATAAQGTGATTKAAGSTSATKAATQATNNGATNTAATNNGATTTGNGGDCAAQPDYDTCDECFCTQNEDGCDAYYELESDACLCGAGSPCEAACANACANDVEDPACDTCYENLSDDDACWTAVDTGCAADAGCSAYLTAIEACDALPD